jgi:hypothetical protein
MPGFTEKQFGKFLDWLNEDSRLAPILYQRIRQELLKFFKSQKIYLEAETLVDAVIERMVERTIVPRVKPLNRVLIFRETAREILKEHKDKEVKESRLTAFDDRLRIAYNNYKTIEDLTDFDDSSRLNRGGSKSGLTGAISFSDLEAMPTNTEHVTRSRNKTRIVSTGFSPPTKPDEVIAPKVTLQESSDYLFWLEIGKPQKGSIEVTPTELPDVPAETVLTIALFSYKDGLQLTKDEEIGQLLINKNGSVTVVQQPGNKSRNGTRESVRLFFPVRTPSRSGTFNLRCNIYSGHTLLQSRLITAQVTKQVSTQTKRALSSVVDYTISRKLDPAHLNRISDHRLSILLNKNDDGTHSFHFFGADGSIPFKQDDVHFNEGELEGMIDQARGTLRIASWGKADEWQASFAYRYKDRKPDLPRLKTDLVNLANWGYEFYTQIRARFAGGEDAVDAFEQIMLQPGSVQIAMKESARYILPVAMLYDYPIDTGAGAYSLCETFTKAFTDKKPFADTECFAGKCPSRKDLTTICPSGFWGFRHSIGLPLSIKNGPDVVTNIQVNGELKVTAGVATDLQLGQNHLSKMKSLRAPVDWEETDSRNRVFELLKTSPHVVYFYCHGGLARKAAYLQIGPKQSPGLILRSNFMAYKIQWDQPRPLVFINGCHTTAVAPSQALEFITPLVTYSHCAGVIGTEVTIFEELATVFAESCMGQFLNGVPIGKALRDARLTLLAEGNPLGLVYIPFVMSGLTLN